MRILPKRPISAWLSLIPFAFSAVLAGCDVGSGNTLGELTIQGNSSLTVFQCFYTPLNLIGTFTHHGKENDTLRATWTSDNPSAVAVSNGELKTPDGATISKGTLMPLGPAGSVAHITASFAGLDSNTITVTVQKARLELFPAHSEVATGTKALFLPTSVLGNEGSQTAVTEERLVIFTASPSGIATIDSSGIATASAAGTVTIGANTNMADHYSNGVAVGQCAAGVASAQLVVHNGPLQGLEIKAINDNTAVPPLVTQAFAARGKFGPSCDPNNDPTCFIQDITGQVSFNYTEASGASLNHSSFFSSSAPGPVTVSASFPDVTAPVDGTTLTVEDTTLSMAPVIQPADAHMVSGTSMQYALSGAFHDTKTYNLTPNTLWTSSDAAVAKMFSNGVVTALSASSTPVTISGTYTAYVSPGVTQTLSPVTTSLTTDGTLLSLMVTQPTGVAPFANASPPQPDPSCNNAGSVPLNGVCRLRADGGLAPSGSQDLTAAVIWSSSDNTVASVSNGAGFNGLVTGLQSGSATITAQSGATTATFPLKVCATPPCP